VRVLKYLWVLLPNTLLGLVLVASTLFTGGRARIVDGVVEASGGFAGFFLRRCTFISASALTLGHVVIGRSDADLDASRTHERVHVRQYERWGPLFLPAYLTASVIALLSGRRAYRDNAFEREAYDKE
jgi:hypothetical protein